jgi:O-antigen/teichoic acid export membrane protein
VDQAVETRQAVIRVGRNAAARLAAQVAAKLLSLILLALITRHEGSAGLGRYVLVTTLVGLAVAVTDLGLSMLLTREVARQRSPSRRRRLLGDLLPLRVALATLGAGILVGLAWVPLFPAETRPLLYLGALSLLPKAAAGTLGGFFNGRQRMDVASAIDVVARLLTLAGAVPALKAGFGVPGVLVCTAAADAVGVLIYGAVLRSWHLLPRLRLAAAQWGDALSDAYPFAVTGIIAMAYRRLDIVLLSAWQGDVAAGQYGAAYRLWEAVGLIPASLLDATFPEMARLAQEGVGHRQLRRLVRRTGPLLLAAGLLLSAVGTSLAGTLVPLVYGRAQAHGSAVTAFRIQVWAIPAMFLYLLNGHTLYALGRQRSVTGAMAIVGLVNVGLNLLVIPRWSTLGVSTVVLFSAWLLWALLSVLARRALRTEEGR